MMSFRVFKSSIFFTMLLLFILTTSSANAQHFSLSASTKETTTAVEVSLSWTQLNKSAGETIIYEVFRNNTLINSSSGTSFIDKSASDGQLYEYCIIATKTVGTDTIYEKKACAKGFSYTTLNLMTASQGESDGYIHVAWKIPYNCAKEANYKAVFVELFDETNNLRIYSQRIDSFPLAPFYKGEFYHWLDSGKTIDYRLKLYQIGFGNEICQGQYRASGTTKPFEWPKITSTEETPYQLSFSWEHKSDLISTYKIYRDDTTLIDELDSSKNSYTEHVSVDGIQNGNTYKYHIELYNKRLNKTYTNKSVLSKSLSLNAINFNASKKAYPAQVELIWNDISKFGDQIKLYRDNKFLAKLPASSTIYRDKNPIYGEDHKYVLRLENKNQTLIEVTTRGNVEANGQIKGLVTRVDNNIVLPGTRISLTYNENGRKILRTTVTDKSGYFNFNKVYYNKGAILQLQASLKGHKFIDSLIELSFSPTNNKFMNVQFKSDAEITQVAGGLEGSISDLSISPKANLDYVELSWTNKLKRESWFQVYRNGILQVVMHDSIGGQIISFKDVAGRPNTEYTYKVISYQSINDTIYSLSLSKKEVFPKVATVSNISININPDKNLGVVNIEVSHESKYYDYLRIYRTNNSVQELIAEIPARDIIDFIDVTGRNGTSYDYFVTSNIIRGQDTFESAISSKTNVDYPLLVGISNSPKITSNGNGLTISWTSSINPQFNYNGYLLVREDVVNSEYDTIGFVNKGYDYTFTDETGIPETSYRYHVFAYKGQQYSLSISQSESETFPKVTPPNNFTSSLQKHVGFIELNIDNQTKGLDGMRLIHSNDTLMLNAGVKKYRYIMPTTSTTNNETFTIENFRLINGRKYFSDSLLTQGQLAPDNGSSFKTPENFSASTKYGNHIRLSWDYPVYIEPSFLLYRNDTLLATLNSDARIYYDYSAKAGIEYYYTLRASRGPDLSMAIADIGRLGSNRSVCGTVYTRLGGFGLPGVKVQAKMDLGYEILTYTAYTDSAGYYQINNLPNLDNKSIEVSANKINCGFLEPTITTSFKKADKINVSFVDTFTANVMEETKVAEINYFNVSSNYLNNTVELRWNVSSANYTGFDLYRGGIKMATLKASDGKFYIDDVGRPDLWYLYSIQAFWELPEGTKKSRFYSRDVQYPGVKAVSELSVEPASELDLVKVQWSHENNLVSWYEVKRSGLAVAIIKPNERLEFIDTTGIPQQTYLYSVKAVKKVGKRTYYSQPDSALVTFPEIASVRNLKADVISIGNAVKLTWNHESMNSIGYRVFRNYELIYDTLRQKNGEVLPPVTEYIDYKCNPGIDQSYQVITYAIRENERYKSGITKTSVTAEAVKPVTNLDTALKSRQDKVLLTWDYSDSAHSGFKVLISANNQLVKEITLQANELEYEHNDGVPELAYSYSVQAFTVRNGIAESAARTIDATFPKLAKPIQLTATDASLPYVGLKWKHLSSSNDGFVIYRNGKPTYTLNRGAQLSYDDVVENITGDRYQEFEYELRAFKIIGTDTLFSDKSNLDRGRIINDFVQNFIGKFPHSTAESFGFSVDVSGDFAVVGAPWSYVYVNNQKRYHGEIFIYKYNHNTNQWAHFQTVTNPSGQNGTEFGYSVAIDGENIIVGEPLYTSNSPYWVERGLIWHFQFDGSKGSWVYRGHYEHYHDPKYNHDYSYDHFGRDVDISGSNVIVGAPDANFDNGSDLRGRAYFFQIDGNNVLQQKTDLYGYNDNDQLGTSVAIKDKRFIIGAPHKSNKSGGYAVTGTIKNDGYIKPQTNVSLTSANNAWEQWGTSVATTKDMALVGAIGEDIKSEDNGAIEFIDYQDESNNEYVYLTNPQKNDYFGRTTMISDYLAGVSSWQSVNFQQDGNVHIYRLTKNGWQLKKELNYGQTGKVTRLGNDLGIDQELAIVGTFGQGFQIFNLVEPVTDIEAKTKSGSVALSWDYHNTDFVDEYRILRDGTEITTVTGTTLKYEDQNVFPGKLYTYTIYAINNDGQQSPATNIHGSSKTDGKITGYVFSSQTGDGLEGINIKASSIINGETYNYTTTSSVGGKYTIGDVYYSDTAIYKVTASYPQHVFIDNEHEVTLETNQNTGNVAPFLDSTAFIIKGTVAHAGFGCGIDSVEISLASRVNGKVQTSTVYTDKKGRYSFTYNPLNPDLEQIIVAANTERTKKVNKQDVVTILSFKKQKYTSSNFTNPDLITELNFEETTTYPVELWVRTTCDSLVGDNQFIVNIRTEDDCINHTLTTKANGLGVINLPPKEYTITVLDVKLPTSSNLPILRYLQPRPITYNLLAVHNANLVDQKPNDSLDLTADLIYHKVPKITFTGFPAAACTALPPVLPQGEIYDLQFSVRENHNNQNCHVFEGYLKVKNPSTGEEYKLTYDPEIGAFPPLAFESGKPNLVKPHQHYLIASYFTADDRFQKRIIQPFIVTGSSEVPGNDVVIDPTQDGRVKMPLFVLRNPPGDGSYSYIEKGTTLTRTLNVSDQTTGSVGFKFETVNVIGAGQIGTATSVTNSGGTGRKRGYTISTTTNQTLQTSSQVTGDSAGIMVGLGVASQYGMVQSVFINDCTVESETNQGFTGGKLTSTWIYTLDQIHKIIGETTLAKTKETDPAKQKELQDLIDNWTEMVRFFEEETLPYKKLCDKKVYDAIANEKIRNRMLDYSEQFCEEIGSGFSTGNFQPNSKIEWNTTRIDKYNKLKQISHDFLSSMNDESSLAFEKYNLVYDKSDDFEDVGFNDAYDAAFGPSAENITFSGGTTANKSMAVSASASRFWSQNYSFSGQFDIILGFKKDAAISAGSPFFHVKQKLLSVNAKGTASLAFAYSVDRNTTSTADTTTTIGYVLSDDDLGDQYSVTVFRGIDKNHSPYFELFGGRTSCPTETETSGTIAIARDRPHIMLEWPNGTGADNSLYNLEKDEVAIFPLKLSNLNTFGEKRNYTLSISGLNRYNAKLSANSTQLGQVTYSIPAGESVYVNLEVERSPNYYQHIDIAVSLSSACDGSVAVELPLEAQWKSPCSNISILTNPNWVITAGEIEALPIKISDYDYENPNLDSIKLEYRRKGTNDWVLLMEANSEALFIRDTSTRSDDADPVIYDFVWNITDQASILDGTYELKATANCGINGFIESNIVPGTINRTGLQLFGKAQPSDGYLSIGESVMATFNLPLDISRFSQTGLAYISLPDGSRIQGISTVASGKQVLFNIPDSILKYYDGVKVKAHISNLYGHTGNGLSAPAEWVFTISYNPVYWKPRKVVHHMYVGDKDTLSLLLNNSHLSAAASYYLTLTNPKGLSISRTNGQILPLEQVPIKLYIDASNLRIDSPTVTSIVTTVTGYGDVQLPIEILVYPKAPVWRVNPAKYANSMNMVANFKIDNGSLSKDSLDLIAIEIAGEIRGVAHIDSFGDDKWVAYMTVYGNPDDHGKTLSFRVWDASAGIEYEPNAIKNIEFKQNTFVGSISRPEILNIKSASDRVRYIPLVKGWNWFSINTKKDDMSLGSVLKSLSPSSNDQIKTWRRTAKYLPDSGWTSAMGLSSLHPDSGYMLNLHKADTLRLTGENATPSLITLNGWNLIGFPHQQSYALDSIWSSTPGADENDIIKSQTEAATFDTTNGGQWQGSLRTLRPYQSYLVKLSEAKEIDLSSHKRESDDPDDWKVNPSAYEFNMTITGVVVLNHIESIDAQDRVAAFINGECRGVGKLTYIPAVNRYMVGIMVYSNQASGSEEITFKIYDADQRITYNAVDKFNFVSQDDKGSFTTPYLFSDQFGTGVVITEVSLREIQAYPNPFSNVIALQFQDDKLHRYQIMVYDNSGRLVHQRSYQSASGANKMMLDLSNLSDGLYYIKAQSNEFKISTKVLKE